MRNRILLGSCEVILLELEANLVDAVVTDPPYGLGSREPTGEEIDAYLKDSGLLNTKGDFMGHKWEIPSVETWRQIARVTKDGSPVMAFASTRTWDLMGAGMLAAGLTYVGLLYWCHSQGFSKGSNLGKSTNQQWDGWHTTLKPVWEPVLIFTKGPSSFTLPKVPFFYVPKPTKEETSVGGEVENTHPTKKPIEVMKWLVRLASKSPDDLILDPFLGSGTTAAACAEENRFFLGIERDPVFFEIASKRVGLVKGKAEAFYGGRAAFDLMMSLGDDE